LTKDVNAVEQLTNFLMHIEGITIGSTIARVLLATLIGGCIGMDRGRHGRVAGTRTHILVCLGAAITTLVGLYTAECLGYNNDPMRIGAQVISGVGFLGVGTIVIRNQAHVKGLTTAAGLWTAAGVGLALGIGFYEAALVGAFAIFFVITMLQRMDNNMHRKSKQVEAYVELSPEISLGDFLRIVRDNGMEFYNVQREQGVDSDEGNRAYIATIKVKKRSSHTEILELIQEIPGVAYMEEL
jgi:putative Mg2+ transporter-C (MgtC) family protein